MSIISNEQNGDENTKKSVSRSETGHLKNVANFEDLITFCLNYGSAYNPSNEAIKIQNLQELLQSAKEILKKVKSDKTSFDNSVDNRRIAFEEIKPFSTRLVNSFSVSGADELTIQNAKSALKKIHGVSSKANKNPSVAPLTEGQEIKRISTSQQSYDRLMDHFSEIIEVLSQSSFFNPNEAELKLPALQDKLLNMQTKNTEVMTAYAPYSTAMLTRDNILYNKLTGLNYTAQLVKKYIKSVFGAHSREFNQVSGIEIKKVGR
jgi:hypothetical protein